MEGFNVKMQKTPPPPSPVYFLGFIGALVYFLKKADNPKQRVLGVGKAFAWPALLVYELLKSMPRH